MNLIHTISDTDDETEDLCKQSEPIVSQTGSDSSLANTCSPVKSKRKRMSKEEQAKKKVEIMLKKAEKKKKAEMLKLAKPGECIKYVTSLVDSGLLSCKYGGELLIALQSTSIQHKVKEQPIPFSISWSRKLAGEEMELEESELVIVWNYDELINEIYEKSFCRQILEIVRLYKKNITLIIYGIEEYFRHQKNETNRNMKAAVDPNAAVKHKKKKNLDTLPVLTRTEIENALIEVQLYSNVCHRFVETGQDLGLLVAQFTKAVAEKPFKLDKYKKEQDSMEWFASGDGRECVRVDSEGNGLLRLWQQQICQFNNVGLEIAQAIVSQYRSPTALIQAYDRCTSKKEAEILLKDIPVRRGQGPLTSVRRVGPELSKKIYLLFNSEDPETPLSQEY